MLGEYRLKGGRHIPYLGRPIPSREDLRFVRGKGEYADDALLNRRSLFASILRSPYAHARILGIDADEARKARGVRAVLAFRELSDFLRPFPLALDCAIQYYPITRGKANYSGEPVAVIIAEDEYRAEDAKEMVRVEYEPLAPVVTIETASKSPSIHEAERSNNVLEKEFTFGNFEQATSKANVIVEDEVYFPRYTCSPLETYVVHAGFDEAENTYNIFSNYQGPFTAHYFLSKALSANVRLTGPKDIGGAFGIKSALYPYMALIAAASRVVKFPVRWVETRTENLSASSAGAERQSKTKIYGDKDGKILAIVYNFIDNLGAYPRAPEPGNLFRNHGNLTGVYDIRALKVRYQGVLTNTVPTGLNRGYGGPHLYLTLESVVDTFASKIGMDKLEVRRRNIISEFPYQTPSGGYYDGGDFLGVLEVLKNTGSYEQQKKFVEKERNKGRRLGLGLSIVVEASGTNIGYLDLARTNDFLPKSAAQEVAVVSIDPYGKIRVMLNGSNEGQSHETVLAQTIADKLGVNIEEVEVINRLDTDNPWTPSTGSYSSRFSSIVLGAILDAAEKLKQSIIKIACKLLEVAPENLVLEDNEVRAGDKHIPIKRLAGIVHWNPACVREAANGLTAVGFYQAPTANTLHEGKINSSVALGCAAHLALVEVKDCFLKILEYIVVHDAGRILNPIILDGQIVGSTFHGIEVALSAQLDYDENGTLLTSSFMDYGVMTASETPEIKVHHLESPSNYPLGASGVGEGGTMAAPAALMNAVRDALGRRIQRMPVSNYSVLRETGPIE